MIKYIYRSPEYSPASSTTVVKYSCNSDERASRARTRFCFSSLLNEGFRFFFQHINPTLHTTMSAVERFKLVFFVPPSHLEICKKAVFNAGAGQYPGNGQYTEVSFQVLGMTQFRPGTSAKPTIGQPGKLENVEEMRFETLCYGRTVMTASVQALRKYVICSTIAVNTLKII